MPELPEVETTKNALSPFLLEEKFTAIDIIQPKLRFPVVESSIKSILNQPILQVSRRAKYLLLHFSSGSLLFHLGMSGHLKIQDKNHPIQKHEHLIFNISNQESMRYEDPRRFGFVLFDKYHFNNHPLFNHLGPEPLSDEFTAKLLIQKSIHKKTNIKTFIMDAKNVVGVGNIYASESLFLSKIAPMTSVQDISEKSWEILCDNIKIILQKAIQNGGTSLKDFYHVDGKKGYFSQFLYVYGRENQPCHICKSYIKRIINNGRSSFYCPRCQKN